MKNKKHILFTLLLLTGSMQVNAKKTHQKDPDQIPDSHVGDDEEAAKERRANQKNFTLDISKANVVALSKSARGNPIVRNGEYQYLNVTELSNKKLAACLKEVTNSLQALFVTSKAIQAAASKMAKDFNCLIDPRVNFSSVATHVGLAKADEALEDGTEVWPEILSKKKLVNDLAVNFEMACGTVDVALTTFEAEFDKSAEFCRISEKQVLTFMELKTATNKMHDAHHKP